jgi:hypothetical protein
MSRVVYPWGYLGEAAKQARREALWNGQMKYDPGVSCARGHISPRYTRSGACCLCAYEYNEIKNPPTEAKPGPKPKHR